MAWLQLSEETKVHYPLAFLHHHHHLSRLPSMDGRLM